ncbi:Two-component sensor histidine kinase, HisKA and HATPase domains [Pannonibacter indicus]|uniref:histidine kinase n=1 Tax=Pannonibacter indicus TaxID=466044 RepID=A0A0K6HQC1_9HYPH|nr:Two-component sensor histidine kinase, HisKA and HATPase domains [Pannonibacter indicus]
MAPVVHRLIWKDPGQPEAHLREYLLLALERSGICLTLQDSQLNYVYAANLPAPWRLDPEAGHPTDAAIFGDELAGMLAASKAQVMASGGPAFFEADLGEAGVFSFNVEQVTSFGARPYLLTTIADLTEKTRREKVLRALLREVSHRSKNLLAIIQSIASQTARHSTRMDQFLAKFRGRLHSLAQSQDLVTDSNWHGAYFEDLVRQQVSRYVPQNPHLVEVLGDNALLDPNAALHVGLALHELMVNAVSYGTALTVGPPVTVRCRLSKQDGVRMVEIVWIETVTPQAGEPGAGQTSRTAYDRHFGSTVLERVVPLAVNGKASYSLTPRLVTYSIEFPVEPHTA